MKANQELKAEISWRFQCFGFWFLLFSCVRLTMVTKMAINSPASAWRAFSAGSRMEQSSGSSSSHVRFVGFLQRACKFRAEFRFRTCPRRLPSLSGDGRAGAEQLFAEDLHLFALFGEVHEERDRGRGKPLGPFPKLHGKPPLVHSGFPISAFSSWFAFIANKDHPPA